MGGKGGGKEPSPKAAIDGGKNKERKQGLEKGSLSQKSAGGNKGKEVVLSQSMVDCSSKKGNRSKKIEEEFVDTFSNGSEEYESDCSFTSEEARQFVAMEAKGYDVQQLLLECVRQVKEERGNRSRSPRRSSRHSKATISDPKLDQSKANLASAMLDGRTCMQSVTAIPSSNGAAQTAPKSPLKDGISSSHDKEGMEQQIQASTKGYPPQNDEEMQLENNCSSPQNIIAIDASLVSNNAINLCANDVDMVTIASPHTGPNQSVGMANIQGANVSQIEANGSRTQGVRQNAATKNWSDMMDLEHGKLNPNAPCFSPSFPTAFPSKLDVDLLPPLLANPACQGLACEANLQSACGAPPHSNPNQPTRAWRKKTHIRINPEHRDRMRVAGQPVQLDPQAIQTNLAKLERALVGKVIGKKLPYALLKAELRKRWDQFGDFSLTSISADCFVCTFAHAEAREAVLLGGPWQILGQVLALDAWTPSFDPKSLRGLTAHIWARLPTLPLLYWDPSSITRIAETIGEPQFIDEMTARQERSEFARVCVKVDLTQQLPAGTMVLGLEGPFWQSFEYEGISQLCFHCGKVGHRISKCPSRPVAPPVPPTPTRARQTDFGPPSTVATTTVGASTSATCPPSPLRVADGPAATEDHLSEPAHGYGPWTIVQRKRPKGPRRQPQSTPHSAEPVLPSLSPKGKATIPPTATTEPPPPMRAPVQATASHSSVPHGTTLRDKLRRLRSYTGRTRVSTAYWEKVQRELGPLQPPGSRRRRPPDTTTCLDGDTGGT